MAAAALGAGGYLYFRLDDEIRRQIEHRLVDHYRHLAVHVGNAQFERDRGIAIHDVSILESRDRRTRQPLLAIDELFLAGAVKIEDLLQGTPHIERIVVRRPRLRARLLPDGSWSVNSLFPMPKFGAASPAIVVEDATVTLEGPDPRREQPLTIRGIELSIVPAAVERAGVAPAQRFQVRGTVSGLPAKELSFEGEIGVVDGSLNLTLTIKDLDVSPELLASIPGLSAELLEQVQVSGRADGTVRITRQPGLDAVLDWSADISVDRGQLKHRLLPHALTDLELTLSAAPHQLKIERLTGRCGTAGVTLACERHGWSSAAPLGLAVRVTSLPLDERLEAVMPPAIASFWKRFRPFGIVDAEVRLAFDGTRWRPQITAECRGLSLTDVERFPYVLEQASGKLQYVPPGPESTDQLTLNLVAVGGGRPVRIDAQLSQLAAGLAATADADSPSEIVEAPPVPLHPVGWLEISGTDVPMHEQLIAAMKEKEQKLVRSLNVQGAIDFHWRAEWTDPAQSRADITQSIALKDCTIKFDKFCYPLNRVNGLLTARNRQWQWHDVEGRGSNDSTIVRCSGQSLPSGEGCQLDLVFQAWSVPLDDNLRQALTEPAQRAWQELRPQGRIDLAARVGHVTGQAAPSIAVTVRPCERSVSIEPQKFSYRLEQIEGLATFQPGRVDLANIVAHHDRATYSAKAGVWQQTGEGDWQFELSEFNSDYLSIHRDLLIALPARLQNMLERLQPSGSFQISNSKINFAKVPGVDRLATAWDVHLNCHQAALQVGVSLDNIWGEVHLVGQDDGQTSYTAGELAIDSLVWKNVQLTNVVGPLWVDRALCLLGRPAPQQQGVPPRQISASIYGGTLLADARIEHDANPRYQLQAALADADLGRFASERIGGPKELTGKVSGEISLSGIGRSMHALNGGGELHVTDAHIYELPVLVSLLKMLRNRTPDSTAFDRCDMQFNIQGEHVQFQQLDLLGDAVSLYGRGETNFDRQLSLVFYSLVGPADLPIPLWKTIAGQVSQQGLQLRVTGSWEKPETQSEVLPSVNQVLQEIQSGIQAGAATIAPPAATRLEDAPVRR